MAKLGCCSNSGSVNDAVCTTVAITDATTVIPIWENTTNFMINGTILVENLGLMNAWDAELIVNGGTPAILTIQPGESASITVNNLTSIDVQGGGTTGTVSTAVKVSFSLNYNF